MFEYKENAENKTIEIIIDGKIEQEEFDKVAPQMEDFIGAHGKIKVLEEIRKFEGMDPSVFWDGLKFDMKHLKDVSHCAVVSDLGWVGPVAKASGVFFSCKIRTFPTNKLGEAKEWLKSAA